MYLKLSELAVFKPTLQLGDEQQLLWARKLLMANELPHLLTAIEHLIHSDKQFIVMGDITVEASRVRAALSSDYAPHRDPSRVPVALLRDMALSELSESAMARIKTRQMKQLATMDRELAQ